MNGILAGLLILALVVVEFLAGGKRLSLSLPSYAILGCAGVLSFFTFRQRQTPLPSLLCLGSSALFFGYVLVRAHFSPVEYLARSDLFSVLGALIVYLTVAFCVTEPKPRIAVVVVLMALALIHLGIAAVQFSKGDDFMPFSMLPRQSYLTRASGMYTSPNFLAGFLELTALICLGMACWSRWKFVAKMVAAYVALLCFGGILLTGNRGGFLGMSFGLLTFVILSIELVRRHRRRRFWRVILISVVALALLGNGIGYLIKRQDQFRSRVEAAFATRDSRWDFWKSALQQFRLNPVFGTGSGTFLYYGRQFRHPEIYQDPVHVHNDYLELLAEYGIVGGATFLIFLFVHLGTAWKAIRALVLESKAEGTFFSHQVALGIGALGAVATFIAHSVVDFNLHNAANVLITAFMFGILANPGVASVRPDPANALAGNLKWALPALGVWLCFKAWPLVPAEYFAERALFATRFMDAPSAHAFAEKGLQYDPRNPYLHFYLGQAKSDLANPLEGPAPSPERRHELLSSAVEDYRRGIALFPSDEVLLLCLMRALNQLERFEEAEALFPRVFALDPNSPHVTATYATYLHGRGKFPEAEAEYRRSLAQGFNWAAKLGLERLAQEAASNSQKSPPASPANEP